MKRTEIKTAIWNGVEINDIRTAEVDIPTQSSVYVVRRDDMLDFISFLFYGKEGYWYRIADANQISDPFEKLDPGRPLVIPAWTD